MRRWRDPWRVPPTIGKEVVRPIDKESGGDYSFRLGKLETLIQVVVFLGEREFLFIQSDY